MAFAFFILSVTKLIPFIILSVIMIGLGQGGLFPTIILRALDSVPTHLAAQTVAWTSSFTYVGQFLSPIVLDYVGVIFQQETVRFQYGALAVSIGIFALCSFGYIFRKNTSKNATTND